MSDDELLTLELRKALLANFSSATGKMTPRERDLFSLLLGVSNKHEYGIREIAQLYGCTDGRVRYLLKNAIRKVPISLIP